jgi:hypothetical protein
MRWFNHYGSLEDLGSQTYEHIPPDQEEWSVSKTLSSLSAISFCIWNEPFTVHRKSRRYFHPDSTGAQVIDYLKDLESMAPCKSL